MSLTGWLCRSSAGRTGGIGLRDQDPCLLVSDLNLARYELDTYSAAPAGEVIDVGVDRFVITRLADATIVSIRGTSDPAQWVSDFRICGAKPVDHPDLGVCESGFLSGALAVYGALSTKLLVPVGLATVTPLILQGHSRGAGMVPILAGLLTIAGVIPARCVCWEAPWSVAQPCRDILLHAGIPGVQYWHGDDPVPTIPAVPWLVPNVWPYHHFGTWRLDPFDCHSMDGIVAELGG